LSHFKTDSKKYDVIFTSGATAALKLVAETFPWEENGSFIYLTENHTSVLGMRELAAKNHAKIYSLTKSEANKILNKKEKNLNLDNGNCLFAYPAQCNFSGVKYPLEWIEDVQNVVLGSAGRTCVLLDAASYVATSQLDLSQVQPDFVCISFYKMFGLPTGLGALLVHKNSGDLLKKGYFGGGTVLMAMSGERKHVPRPLLHER
jgi:molybdenum cofactor sulfurtransferase